jgi:hypothetical protein
MDPARQCREDNPRFGDRSTNPFFAPWCERPPPRAVFRCTSMRVRRLAAFREVSPATVSPAPQNKLKIPIATRKKV